VKEDASEHSQRTAFGISSARPILPMDSSDITFARPSAIPPVKRVIIGVSMYPGQTALMRMLRAAKENELVVLGVLAEFHAVVAENALFLSALCLQDDDRVRYGSRTRRVEATSRWFDGRRTQRVMSTIGRHGSPTARSSFT
jgi:hypothetical protein